jgi:hypothetical protein
MNELKWESAPTTTGAYWIRDNDDGRVYLGLVEKIPGSGGTAMTFSLLGAATAARFPCGQYIDEYSYAGPLPEAPQ